MNSNIVIQDCFKTYRHDLDKVVEPEKTLRHVKGRLEGLDIQVLAKTMRIDTGRLDIPVYLSFCGDDAARLTGTRKQMGKGATAVQAETSAVMELVERFSFFNYLQEASLPFFSYGQMAGEAMPVELLMRSVHDETTPPELLAAFLEECPLRWVPAFNLTRGVEQWVPLDWFYLINEYNGPAAGNTFEEAVLQGLCEVVERHVGSVISHETRPTPAVERGSLSDPVALELLEKFDRRGVKLYLRDFSLDTGIPTVGVLAYDPATFPERSEIVFTAGTTTDPAKSLCRALTEVAQLAGDFENRTSYKPTLPKYTALEEADYLMRDCGTVSMEVLPQLAHDNLRVEIERCAAALERIGLEVLVIDTTHPLLGIPAAYVIVPGAHFLERTRDTDAVQHSARTLLQGRPPADAMQWMRRLLDVFGPRYDLTFFLAHSLELQERPAEALEVFEKALTQQPDPREVASVHVHIGACRKDLGQYRKALDALQAAEEHNPELKEIYNLRGFCHYRLKEHHEAIAAFERALELDPGSAIDYANIGSNLRELGHKKEAVKLYRMALELDSSIDFARWNLEKLEAELKD